MSRVEISRPDKVLWPEPGITKQEYADYLDAVADLMLPWVRERPLTLVRAPDGVEGQRYFQKDTPSYAPDWIRTVTIPAPSAKRDVALRGVQRPRHVALAGQPGGARVPPRAGSPRIDSIVPTSWWSTSTRPTMPSTPRSRWRCSSWRRCTTSRSRRW